MDSLVTIKYYYHMKIKPKPSLEPNGELFHTEKMPFQLINVGATFQREMDIAFQGLINKYVVFYLDDVTIYSKQINDHLSHLRQKIYCCRKYGIFLNPKKTFFFVTEENLLCFVVSKNGIEFILKELKPFLKFHFLMTRNLCNHFREKLILLEDLCLVLLK